MDSGKWLRDLVYVARTAFPGPIQCVGIPMLGLCRRCMFSWFAAGVLALHGRPFGPRRLIALA